MRSFPQNVIKQQGRAAKFGGRTWQRVPCLQGDGIFPRYLLPLLK